MLWVAAGVRLGTLHILPSSLVLSPKTTLLNISSTFFCRLFKGTVSLPLIRLFIVGADAKVLVEGVGAGGGRGAARVDSTGSPPAPPPGAAAPWDSEGPMTDPPNLKAVCLGGVLPRGENSPGGKGVGAAGGGVGAVMNSLISCESCRGGRHLCSSCCIFPISKGSTALLTPSAQANIARPSVSKLYALLAPSLVLMLPAR